MSGTSVTEWHQAWRSLEVSEDAFEEFLFTRIYWEDAYKF